MASRGFATRNSDGAAIARAGPHILKTLGRAWAWRWRMEAGESGTIQNLAQPVGSGERYEPTATIPLLLVTVIASTGYLDYLNRDL